MSSFEETIRTTATTLCSIRKERYILWTTLLRKEGERYNQSVDAEILSTNNNVSMDSWLTTHSISEFTGQQVGDRGYLDPFPGRIPNGLRIEEIILGQEYKGALLLICAGDPTTMSENEVKAALKLKIVSCTKQEQ